MTLGIKIVIILIDIIAVSWLMWSGIKHIRNLWANLHGPEPYWLKKLQTISTRNRRNEIIGSLTMALGLTTCMVFIFRNWPEIPLIGQLVSIEICLLIIILFLNAIFLVPATLPFQINHLRTITVVRKSTFLIFTFITGLLVLYGTLFKY